MTDQNIEKAIIRAENVSKVYHDGTLNVEVLKNVDILIRPAEQVAILGVSGSGKSTLLHLLGGLDRYTSGQIFVDNEDISQMSERQLSRLRNQKLGFIYQLHHLLPEFSVLENVAIPLLLRGGSVALAKERAHHMLVKVGLAERVLHKIGELSGGERQRTAIARALVTNPLCILADEPTGNLDEVTAQKVYDTMLELNRDYQTSLVIVTHDRTLAKRMDRILHLENKKLVEE